MKKVILLAAVFVQVKIVQGQIKAEGIFLSTPKHLFYVELNEQNGTVFNLGKWLDKAGTAYSILYTDIIIKPAVASTFLFEGNKAKIERVENKLYLITQVKNKKLEIDGTLNADIINNNINNAYWWDNFLKMCKDLDSSFKLYHYSFRNGFNYWKSFNNKEIYYKDFKIYADNKLKIIKDSITAVQTPYVLLTNEVIKNIATINYTSLKDSIAKLPAEYQSQSGYFGTIINSICNNRPELFFKLAKDMPEKKEMIFNAVNDKQSIKKLKATASNSVAKKEFLKAKKADKSFTVKAIAASVAGAAVLGYCITALVK